jgi:hypothetical protein
MVAKCMRILHLALTWNINLLPSEKKASFDALKALRKKVSRKILLLVEKLTFSDEELLK